MNEWIAWDIYTTTTTTTTNTTTIRKRRTTYAYIQRHVTNWDSATHVMARNNTNSNLKNDRGNIGSYSFSGYKITPNISLLAEQVLRRHHRRRCRTVCFSVSFFFRTSFVCLSLSPFPTFLLAGSWHPRPTLSFSLSLRAPAFCRWISLQRERERERERDSRDCRFMRSASQRWYPRTHDPLRW